MLRWILLSVAIVGAGCQQTEEEAITGTWQVQGYTLIEGEGCGEAPATIEDPSSCVGCMVPASGFVMGNLSVNGRAEQIVFPCEGAEACGSVDVGSTAILEEPALIRLDSFVSGNWQSLEQSAGIEGVVALSELTYRCTYEETETVLDIEGEAEESLTLTRTHRTYVVELLPEEITSDVVAACLDYVESPPTASVICDRVEQISAAKVVEEEE